MLDSQEMATPSEKPHLSHYLFQHQTSLYCDSPSNKNHRSGRLSVSSTKSWDSTSKQELSKKQSLPTTIQERVAHGERYKTEMCKQFQLYKSCRYDNKCQYAHGEAELRSINRHPKYKTEQCRTYHTTGFCPYGARCHFVHDKDPSKPIEQQESNKKRKVSLTPSNDTHNPQDITNNNGVPDKKLEQYLNYQISLILEQQQQQQHQQQYEQLQFQMLQQFHQQQQEQLLQQQHQTDDIWRGSYNSPLYSTGSTGSRSPLNSDSERSSPSYNQTPPFNYPYPTSDITLTPVAPFYSYDPTNSIQLANA